tara:strand:+ start:1267 stop:1407 length:141 start_codon:yes stop_codon:yes gene_type:complete
MNRYSSIETYKTGENVTYLGVTRYPIIPEQESDIYVITTYETGWTC